MKKQEGFTLAELLIVVAIVGTLVGISIPIFNKKVLKSKIATNQANIRAAKAAVIAEYTLDVSITTYVYYTYDIKTGTLTFLERNRPNPPHPGPDGIFDTIQLCIDCQDHYKFYTRPFMKKTAYDKAKTIDQAFETQQFGYTGHPTRDN